MEMISSMPGLSLQSLSLYLLLIVICTLRVGAFLISSPFFGSRMVPLPVRIVCSVSLGLWVLGSTKLPNFEILTSFNLIPIIGQEIIIGLSAGMALSICFGTVILAGEKIAATSGLAFASQVDPTSGAQSPVISQIFSLFLLLIFFALNGHLVILKLIFASFQKLPIGSFADNNYIVETALSSANFLFDSAVTLVLPIVSILFFINLGIGFITKSAPQLNLFSFGFPLTILATFFALYFSVDALQFVFAELLNGAIKIVTLVLRGDIDG